MDHSQPRASLSLSGLQGDLPRALTGARVAGIPAGCGGRLVLSPNVKRKSHRRPILLAPGLCLAWLPKSGSALQTPLAHRPPWASGCCNVAKILLLAPARKCRAIVDQAD